MATANRNPKAEIRNPKEVRSPKSDTVSVVAEGSFLKHTGGTPVPLLLQELIGEKNSSRNGKRLRGDTCIQWQFYDGLLARLQTHGGNHAVYAAEGVGGGGGTREMQRH